MNKILWLTGRSGSGKTTLALALKKYLEEVKFEKVVVLDGDELRKGINSDLGFSEEDRVENGRRIAHTANLFRKEGYLVICPVLSPFENMRQVARKIIGKNSFIEVHVDASLSECIKRDPKGLYASELKVRPNSTILYYEEPTNPHIKINTETHDIDKCINKLITETSIHLGYQEGAGI